MSVNLSLAIYNVVATLMTVHRSALYGALVALVFGSGVRAFLGPARENAIAQNSPISALTANSASLASAPDEPRTITSAGMTSPFLKPPPAASEVTYCEELPRDHPLRSKLNGKRLALDYDGLQQGAERRLLSEAKVRFLSDGRLLAGLGGTLYMLDSRKRVEWTYTACWVLWDFAVVESTGLVYGTGGDNIMFILDSATGKKLYRHGRNGKFAYGQVVRFGEDICLITNNLAGYRDGLDWETNSLQIILTDGVTAWRGTRALWSMPFPPDAELVVNGDRIFAVTKTDKSIYVRQITPPKTDASE
jgi:hypothetical protein